MGGKKYLDTERVYIVYKTTNLLNGMIYIGKHVTDTPYEFDGYLGSGDRIINSVKKHGKENFIRETLFVFEDEDVCYAKEAELVTPAFINRKDTYNIGVGGYGNGSGENNPMFGKTGEDNPNYGKHHTDETKLKMSIAKGGENCSAETRKKMSIANSGKPSSMLGKHHSDAAKLKNSIAHRGKKHYMYGKYHTTEAKLKRSIARLGEDVYYQRLKDVEEIEKVYGWKSKLAREWGVIPAGASRFLKRWCLDYGGTSIEKLVERKNENV